MRLSLEVMQWLEVRGLPLLMFLSSPLGTTWMQEILTLIYSKGDPQPAKNIPNWTRNPWLEHTYFSKILRETEGPRLLTTHLPYRVLSASLRKAKPKVCARRSHAWPYFSWHQDRAGPTIR